MSDPILHECGVSLMRLRKSSGYYLRKYGSANYALAKTALILEKQHNRGQDGAGIAGLSLEPVQGERTWFVEKSVAASPLADLLVKIGNRIDASNSECGELSPQDLVLGHLRYATFGRNDINACHPFVRECSRLLNTLFFAGNFNLTGTTEIFKYLGQKGIHLTGKADGYLLSQLLGYELDTEAERALDTPIQFDKILSRVAKRLDGAYMVCGMTGNGYAFAMRDPNGIRPGYYYQDDEIFVVASERPALQAAFNLSTADVQEVPPGHALLITPDGSFSIVETMPPQERRSCVFERIYFSRANDADIHQERKALGAALVPQILEACEGDFDNTFFSYIPNSAQVCFHGMLEELAKQGLPLGKSVRFGQIAVKDAKFRTFIADANLRRDFYQHVYDVTYGLIRPGADTLVVLDDSIVRGNTMRNAILPMLDRLGPKKIVVASSAPPIMYPDCYGIDMATLNELVAYRALQDLLNSAGIFEELTRCYEKAKTYLERNKCNNALSEAYALFDHQQLSNAIASRLRPAGMRAELSVVFQTCDALRAAIPNHTGDWYFTGRYPTQGGYNVVNRALIRDIEHSQNARSYE